LKRELAAEQIVEHTKQLGVKWTNGIAAIVIAGDFNTSRDQTAFVSEGTLTTLQSAGFTSGFEAQNLEARITCPGNGKYPDATFDYIFATGARILEVPKVMKTPVSDHYPVTSDLVF
jgi:endonuclease/exonuclease/phosphatase family metal-dependent hydrolase